MYAIWTSYWTVTPTHWHFLNQNCFFFFFRYVSRHFVRDSAKHVILGTQQFKPSEFANQINLNMDNSWGVLRCIIDTCMKLDEGKYLIMKDPNKVSTCMCNLYISANSYINILIFVCQILPNKGNPLLLGFIH